MMFHGQYLLLAEDDPAVAEIVMHALHTVEPGLHIVHVRDGVDALNFLHASEQYEHRDPGQPAFILMDVKMPRVDGLEVLRQIKGDSRLRSIPVVMLTSSQDERDVRESYAWGANAYVVKPVEFRWLLAVLHELVTFWMRINHPPPETHWTPAPVGALSSHPFHRDDSHHEHSA